jgi:hypothetical protein
LRSFECVVVPFHGEADGIAKRARGAIERGLGMDMSWPEAVCPVPGEQGSKADVS